MVFNEDVWGFYKNYDWLPSDFRLGVGETVKYSRQGEISDPVYLIQALIRQKGQRKRETRK